jgi:hypothetical protein
MRYGLNVDVGGGEKVYYPLNWLNAIWLQNNMILMKKRWICLSNVAFRRLGGGNVTVGL